LVVVVLVTVVVFVIALSSPDFIELSPPLRPPGLLIDLLLILVTELV
jgi:hypothetical protein